MALDFGENWVKIYDIFHQSLPDPSKEGKHIPIPLIIIPSLIDNYIIALNISTSYSKPSWQFAGKVFPIISVSAGSDIGNAKFNKPFSLLLNEPTILNIVKLTTYYRIGINLPPWFVDAYIQAWVYTGVEPVLTIDQRFNKIDSDLARLETKIDTIQQQTTT